MNGWQMALLIILTIFSILTLATILSLVIVFKTKLKNKNSTENQEELKTALKQIILENFVNLSDGIGKQVTELVKENGELISKLKDENNSLITKLKEENNNITLKNNEFVSSLKSDNKDYLTSLGNINKSFIDLLKEQNSITNKENTDHINEIHNLDNEFHRKQNENIISKHNEISNKLAENKGELEKSIIDEYVKVNSNIQREIEKIYKNNNDQLEIITKNTNAQLEKIQSNMNQQIEKIKGNIDEYFQDKLDNKLKAHFDSVDKSMNDLNNTIISFNTVKVDIDKLNKSFSNSKGMGIVGEASLRMIFESWFGAENKLWFEQVSLDQIIKNKTISDRNGNGEGEIVDFVFKFKGENNQDKFIPIDAKFPNTKYTDYIEAKDDDSRSAALKNFTTQIRNQAKSISEKYIKPEITTEFAIMYLPSEALYGLVHMGGNLYREILTDYKVIICSPNTVLWTITGIVSLYFNNQMEQNIGSIKETLNIIYKKYTSLMEKLNNAKNFSGKSNKAIEDAIDNFNGFYERITKDAKKLGLKDPKNSKKTHENYIKNVTSVNLGNVASDDNENDEETE